MAKVTQSASNFASFNEPLDLTSLTARAIQVDLHSLIKELQQMYPDRAARVKTSEFDQGYTAGSLAVIEHLQSKLFGAI